MNSVYQDILTKIESYKRIIIFRHEAPDYDALGSQFGFYHWLKDNFEDKEIYVTGSDHVTFTPRLYPHIDELSNDIFEEDFLALVLDTGNTKRIDDKRFTMAKEIIKIDHHPNLEPYATINLVQDELSSCAELIADFMFSFEDKYKISVETAKYLYSGIVGDSGRFLFASTSPDTLKISARLMEKGFNPSYDVYLKMYQKTHHDLEIMKHVLNSCVFLDNGIAYYILTDDDLKKLNIPHERGKENLSLMSNLEDIEVWMSITEKRIDNEFKVSIRSKRIPINDIANKYQGGGHDLASGATLKTLDELKPLIEDLALRIKEYKDKE